MKIGDKIRQIREHANQTQKVFAKDLKIYPETLSRFETGGRKPNLEFLLKLGNRFNLSGNWLLFDETPVFRTAVEDKSIEEWFFELKIKLEKGEGLKPSPVPTSITIDLESLGNDPKDFLTLLEYMLKDTVLCRNMLQFFYLFQKPEADRRLTAAQNTQSEIG